MTMFLAILLTFVLTAIAAFIGAHAFIFWMMTNDVDYLKFWESKVKEVKSEYWFDDEDEDEE